MPQSWQAQTVEAWTAKVATTIAVSARRSVFIWYNLQKSFCDIFRQHGRKPKPGEAQDFGGGTDGRSDRVWQVELMFCPLGEQLGAKIRMSWEARAAGLFVGAWHVAGGQGQAVAQQFSLALQQAAAQSSPAFTLLIEADIGDVAIAKANMMSAATFI